MSINLMLKPIDFKEAKHFILRYHRHNNPPQGHKFSIGLSNGDEVIGVIIVGKPIARLNNDGWTLEVTRCCVLEGYHNACSKLYAAAWRAARAIGYKRLITYTLATEPGTSLLAAGWKRIGTTQPRINGWDTPCRKRVMSDKYPKGKKNVWGIEM